MQRSLLEFVDPNGYTIQISEIADPRLEQQERLREAEDRQPLCREPSQGVGSHGHGVSGNGPGKELYGDQLGLGVIDSESDTP